MATTTIDQNNDNTAGVVENPAVVDANVPNNEGTGNVVTPTTSAPATAAPSNEEISALFDKQLTDLQAMRDRYKDKDMIEAERQAQKDPTYATATKEKQERLVAERLKEIQRKREKREKAARVISAVGDGLSALSNLFFTTQYAPNMYNAENSLTGAAKARQDELRKQRDADRDKYLEYSLKVGDLETGKAKTLRELEAQQEKMKMAREDARRKEEAAQREAALHPFKVQQAEAEAQAAGHKATTAEAEANAAEGYYAARTDNQRASAQSHRASASASYATATGANKTKHHFNGQEYASDRDYKRAVLREARKRGVSVQEDVPGGIGQPARKRDRNIDDVAAEVENLIENTPPSQR